MDKTKQALQVAGKAWVAAVGAALTAALPAINDATNTLLTAAVAAVVLGAGVYLVPNQPVED